MFKTYTALCALAAQAQAAEVEDASNHWAIIVAGSRGFGNYRHQADACHAYQILKKAGIPESQIIHINYDDVANSSENKRKGTLYNKPTPKGTPGVNVYEGCQIDYKGADATKENLLAIFQGDPTSTGGKTLKSDANSKVFFSFFDHGAPGLVAMPVGSYLYADELFKSISYAHQNSMYKEMTVYMEACEGGSMFEGFNYKDLNVYALSATNSKVSSWGTYCRPNDMVDGVSVGSCLGDLFSVNWMEDTDAHSDMKETLKTQYDTVKKETTKSPVCEWGDLTIQDEDIGQFQSNEAPKEDHDDVGDKFWKLLKRAGKSALKDAFKVDKYMSQEKNDSAVNSRDINLNYLYGKVMDNATIENTQALTEALNQRMLVDKRFASMFPKHFEAVKDNAPLPTDYDCYRTLVDTYETHCGQFDDYSMKYMATLVAECEGIKSVPEAIKGSIGRIQEQCPLTN